MLDVAGETVSNRTILCATEIIMFFDSLTSQPPDET